MFLAQTISCFQICNLSSLVLVSRVMIFQNSSPKVLWNIDIALQNSYSDVVAIQNQVSLLQWPILSLFIFPIAQI